MVPSQKPDGLAPSFSTPSDQEWMLARLDRTSVPLVILNEENYQDFAEAYQLLDQYLGEHYEPVGGVTLDNGMELTLLAHAEWRALARSTFGEDEWPCEREPLVRSEAEGPDVGVAFRH